MAITFEEKLQKIGLTGNESKVYVELLKQKELSANQIAKNLSLDRTLSYSILNKLIEKGLVSSVLKQKKKIFLAESPKNLLNEIKKKEIFALKLIGDLKRIEKTKEHDYEVRVYEGKEGYRTWMQKVMEHNGFCSFGATGRGWDIFYEMEAFADEMLKKGFYGKSIFPPKCEKHDMIKMAKHKNMKVRFLDVKSEATTSIFGEYISIHLLTGKPLVILIKNKEIAKSYKNHFNVLWEIAKRNPEEL